jgi:hypothetical protein
MPAPSSPVLVRSYTSAFEFDRRQNERRASSLDATTRPLDARDSLVWGATVCDVSKTGLALTLCFPFRAGTFLSLDLHGPNPNTPSTTILSRVVHVRDQHDGSWQLGCEFVKPLSEDDLEALS